MGNTEWFTHDRFGLFIHWGLYALPARHEWVRHNERTTNDEYQKYFKHFEPDLYDPNLWAEAASNAGMKYFVVTTKHHEGFSPVGHAVVGLQGTEHARRPRPAPSDGRCVPC